MKLHIIGPGVVGKATGEGFKRFGHQVVYTDRGDNHAVEADLHLICTPEDTVKEVVQELAEGLGPSAEYASGYHQVVVRSSVPPGTTTALAKKYPGVRFWHNPEFLREATAESDFLHADRAVLGYTDNPFCYGLDQLYHEMGVPIYRCSSAVSEMVKLVTNASLATQLGFWQTIQGLCETKGLNSHQVGRLVALDPRVSSYGPGMHGTSYGHTKCLPKDLAQLIRLGNEAQRHVDVLEAVRLMDVVTQAIEMAAKERECASS